MCFITDYSTLLANEVHVSPGPKGPRLGADLGLGSCKNDPRNVGSSLITIHCIMHEPLSGVIFLAELWLHSLLINSGQARRLNSSGLLEAPSALAKLSSQEQTIKYSEELLWENFQLNEWVKPSTFIHDMLSYPFQHSSLWKKHLKPISTWRGAKWRFGDWNGFSRIFFLLSINSITDTKMLV